MWQISKFSMWEVQKLWVVCYTYFEQVLFDIEASAISCRSQTTKFSTPFWKWTSPTCYGMANGKPSGDTVPQIYSVLFKVVKVPILSKYVCVAKIVILLHFRCSYLYKFWIYSPWNSKNLNFDQIWSAWILIFIDFRHWKLYNFEFY